MVCITNFSFFKFINLKFFYYEQKVFKCNPVRSLNGSSTGTFVSCKDYDDDIDELTSRVDGIESQIKDLEAKINAANWITSVTPATGGFTVAFNDGSSYTITNGKDGEAGAAGTEWTISEDGFWVCNGEKTTVKAVGQDGAQGEPGKDLDKAAKVMNIRLIDHVILTDGKFYSRK